MLRNRMHESCQKMNTVEDNGREEMTRVFDMTRRETLGVGGCRRHAAGCSFVGDDRRQQERRLEVAAFVVCRFVKVCNNWTVKSGLGVTD